MNLVKAARARLARATPVGTERRGRFRRRWDRWGNRFDRGCLLVLVVLYLQGFQSEGQIRKDSKATRVATTRLLCVVNNRNVLENQRLLDGFNVDTQLSRLDCARLVKASEDNDTDYINNLLKELQRAP